jgi:hypothetical protein
MAESVYSDEEGMTAQLCRIQRIIALLATTACTQPTAQPEQPIVAAKPYVVSDKGDPFDVKRLVGLDDPSRIGQTVVVGNREYTARDYVNLARDAHFNSKNNGLFEVSIRVNFFGEIKYSKDGNNRMNDLNFKAYDQHWASARLSADFLKEGHFYSCPQAPLIGQSTYIIDRMHLACAGGSGDLWIGLEPDEAQSSLYKVPREINDLIEQSIENTKIWDECHKEPSSSTNYKYKEPALLVEKCMEERGIKRTYIYVFYRGEKITTYRFFIMDPYNPDAPAGTKPGWRLVGHLPYSLNFMLN